MTTEVLNAVKAADVAEALKGAGLQVTQVGEGAAVQLYSASQGFSFTVRWGNRAVGDDVAWLDFGFSFVLRIQGELAEEFVNNWNRAKRFARLVRHGEFLALDMDVLAVGVAPAHLTVSAQIWGRIMQEFFQYVHDPKVLAAQLEQAQASSEPAPAEAST